LNSIQTMKYQIPTADKIGTENANDVDVE
jgi:hypothetical protein